jgi:putative addiction module killer protein
MFEAIIELREYITADGRSPFSDWLDTLDSSAAVRVLAYRDRMRAGHWGNFRFVGEGVWELKINLAPGCRIYYLRDGSTLVILLCGGDKASQQADIRQAHRFAADYWRHQ